MAGKKKSSRNGQSPLTAGEILLYGCVTVLSIAYVCYSVYRDSLRYDGILNLYDFGPGWGILGREQDISNYEWHFWYSWFWYVWPWYMAHMALSRIIEWHFLQWRRFGLLLMSLTSLFCLLGWKSVFLYVFHCSVLYWTAATKSTAAVWVASLAMLSTLNFEPFISMLKSTVTEDEEERWYYLLMFTIALVNIRGTSFCLEKCWVSKACESNTNTEQETETETETHPTVPKSSVQTETEQSKGSNQTDTIEREIMQYDFQDLLLYAVYLPLFFTGPILTYDLFRTQMNTPIPKWTGSRVASLTLNFIRFLFWGIFNEFILHYLYFNSLQQNVSLLQSVSLWTLVGIGYCQGQFFMCKYLVMFGVPASVARTDNLDPPQGPKCISYVYLYSDMWKYFDRGLYSFLKRYIYIACGGSRHGLLRQILGSVLCFAYIFYWHGAEYYIFLWILLNFVAISFEIVGGYVSQIGVVKQVESQLLSAAMVQRLHSVCAIPVFLMSCISIFCFFGGQRVSYIFFQRLIVEGTLLSWCTLGGILYCAIQNAVEINRWLTRRQNLKVS